MTAAFEPYFRIHVFCCINERKPGHSRGSCAARGSADLQAHMKARAKELGLEGVRINKSGCLDRCELGPVMVIYPEGIWYTYHNTEDVDEILDSHVVNGKKVERLLLAVDQEFPVEKIEGDITLKVMEVTQAAPGIKRFELAAADGAELPEFTAGAHIDVATGARVRRSYSLLNDPAVRDRYVLGVLREPESEGGSAWMHDSLAEGDEVFASPPANNFALNENADQYILIAGGIGITPLLSMGRRLRALGKSVALHYCTKSAKETAFMDEARDIFGDGVTFHHDGGDPAKGIDLRSVLKSRPDGSELYLCGPVGLINAARDAAANWPGNAVHFELFHAEEEEDLRENESFEIELKHSGMTLIVPPEKNILEVVREAGVDVASACEEGVCGTCVIKILSGGVDHRDMVLSDEQRAGGAEIAICTSRAMPGEKLVLDL